MVALAATVAYLGLEARAVEVQCQIAPGLPGFHLVGLPDKAVNESRQRVQAALAAMGLSLPPKRITVNLSPADLPKEGSHYDLPIALALLAAMGVTDAEQLGEYVAVGELALDGRIVASPGVLLAALHAHGVDKGLICPAAQGAEARWASAWSRSLSTSSSRRTARADLRPGRRRRPTSVRLGSSSTASTMRTPNGASCCVSTLRRERSMRRVCW